MFLKSIEIKGFKSFADKTEIVFKNGITSIVGPNGSGKSNISDAVRWVLGEQSIKTLRGGKMEDVIFAGTQYRKPVGLSQVSLILDNSDLKLPLEFSDITISRRLYRSGESDYLINNTSCRLKDIHELFMDTGIGREGYSIIGQGKIEAILSGRQEDRRGLLEEAAGIVKFRFRKEEAEKKLYNTEQNLIRINDILDTFIERLEPLRIDSEKAERFLELSEKLKIKELSVLVTLIDENEKTISNLEKKLELIENDTLNLRDSEKGLKVLQDELSASLENLETTFNEKNKEIYETKEFLNKLEADNNLSQEKLNNLDLFMEKSKNEIEEIDLKLSSLKKSMDEYKAELNENKNQDILMDSEINKLQEFINDAEFYVLEKEDKLKNLKDNQISIIQNMGDIKNQLNMLESNLESHNSKIDLSNKSIEEYKNQINENSNAKNELLNEINENNLVIEKLQQTIVSNNENVSKLSNHIQNSDIELKKLNLLHNKLEANKNMLINMDKRHEGYNKAVKVLFQDIADKKLDIESDSCFLLGDVIDVPREFETAMETAIGGSISDVITLNEEIAKKSIDYLKTNGLGRATFLPLSIIKPKSSNARELKSMDGFLGAATGLIKYDPKFENAISYLLGRTLISTDMNAALKIAKTTGYSYKIVTLSGEVINPSGSMTGGSTYHKSTNVIGRKREIEELTSKLDSNLIALEALEKDLESSRHKVKELNENNSELKEEIHGKKIEITKLKGRTTALELDISRLNQRLATSENEIIETLNTIKDEKSKIDELKIKLTSLENVKSDEEVQIRELEEFILQREGSVKLQKEKLTECKIKKAQVDEIIQKCSENLTRLENEAGNMELRKSDILNERETADLSINEFSEKIDKNNLIINDNSLLISSLNENIESLNLEKIKIKDSIRRNTDDMETIKGALFKKENDIKRLEINKGKYETEKEIYYGKLNDEMNLTYAEACTYKTDIEDMNAFKADISTLKSEISALGTVNPGAIQEYKEIVDKISFMETQKDDLNHSKDELNHLISNMTDKMKEVFKENFIILRRLFSETFQELFKGGSADLILAPGDELQGNIDIEVQPPGKKLQNINLLSGGEKGLSAIALLFAILKMKPTPFCILDEIEAALDDANVSRYAEFLKKFSKDIQFIVITHRKGTMEVSDALYGVTMEEKGVSKIVSVDFSRGRDVNA
ncbi:MAG: chromosome segregation protein SMC [Solirubrobacterales bacterium]